MEPFRPSIDLLAAGVAGKNYRLSAKQRATLRKAPRIAVHVDDDDMTIQAATRLLVRSFRRAVTADEPSSLALPTTMPAELLDMVEE